MTERIKFEVDDAELEAVIGRLDEAILKKAELFDIEIPQRLGEEVIAEAEIIEAYVDATREQLIAEILTVEETVQAVDASVQMTIQKIMAELSGVQTYAETLRRVIAFDFEQIRIAGDATVARIGRLQAFAKDLPQIDRATRMLLLRIPGLREVLRMLYIIKMEERTMRLGGIRGPVTAIITAVIYMTMLLKALDGRQARMEARLQDLEKREEMRFISIEEAVRGYGDLAERYRSTVSP